VQLEHYMKVVTALFSKAFLVNIYLTVSSSACPKNPQ